MTDAQTEARAIVARIDDITVEDGGFCSWGAVATAASEIERAIATALAAKDRQLAEARKALDAADRLIAAFDELQNTTVAERIITGQSDADLRKRSKEALNDLREARRVYAGGEDA